MEYCEFSKGKGPVTEWKSKRRLYEEVENDLQPEGGWEPHSLRERGSGFLVGIITWGYA